MYTLPNQPDEMHIKSSVSEITLDKGKANNVAITFNWSEATSPIENYESITYALRLYATETENANSTAYYELGDKTEFSLTHEELNSIISKWVNADTRVSVTAEVVATVHNKVKYIKPEVSSVEFQAVGYEKYPQYLYMHMISASGTTSIERLSQRNLGTGIYEASVNIVPGSYYFTTSKDKEYPAYGQADGDKMQYVTEGVVKKFENSITGKRTVIVDVNDEYNDCRLLNIISLPIPNTLYICGSGCSIGWEPSSAEGLFEVEDSRNPQLYSWTGTFNEGGEIKVNTGTTFNDQFFFAPVANADPATDHRLYNYRYQSAGGDLKWVIKTSGRYKFTLSLDADDMWTSFEPVQ